MTDIRHITDAEYSVMAEAIRDAKYPSWTEAKDGHGCYKRIHIELPFATIVARCYETIEWETGATDDYGNRERIANVTKRLYDVSDFACFTMDDNGDYWDTESDFDSAKLENLLNGK